MKSRHKSNIYRKHRNSPPGKIPYSSKPGPKLRYKDKMFLLEILAMGYSPTLAAQEMLEERGIRIARENISHTYLHSAKWRHRIEHFRNIMDARILQHPLANKNVRLGYILRALNYALKDSVNKMYFTKGGRKLATIYEKKIGVIPMLLQEAADILEGRRSGEGADGKKKLDLLQVIKQISKDGTTTVVENRIGGGEAETPIVDQPGPGGLRIVGRTSSNPPVNTPGNRRE